MRQSPGPFGLTAQKIVDFLQLPFIAGRRFPVVVQRQIPMVLPFRKTTETPQLQHLPGGRCSCCAGRVPCPLLSTSAHGSDPAEIRGGSAVAVPPVVDVAVFCSDKFVSRQ